MENTIFFTNKPKHTKQPSVRTPVIAPPVNNNFKPKKLNSDGFGQSGMVDIREEAVEEYLRNNNNTIPRDFSHDAEKFGNTEVTVSTEISDDGSVKRLFSTTPEGFQEPKVEGKITAVQVFGTVVLIAAAYGVLKLTNIL
jgi:hypothetical protein